MFEILLSQNVCVYVMLMIGFVGITGRGIVNRYLKSLVKGAEEMGQTRKKALLMIRKRYEDIASLEVEINDYDSFVDKYIDRLKLGGISVHGLNAAIKNLGILVAGTGIFSALYQYYVVGDGMEAVKLAACGAGVCMVMAVFRNQWDAEWHMKILRDGVKNYLSNSLANRLKKEEKKQAAATLVEFAAKSDGGSKESAKKSKRAEDSSYDALLDRLMQKALTDG